MRTDSESPWTVDNPEHPSEPHPDPAVQALINDGWLEQSDRPVGVADLEHAVSLVREVDADRASKAAAALRAELLASRLRWSHRVPPHITVDVALGELRRHRERWPTVPVEVTAVHLVRQVDQWDEVTAILSALAAILKIEASAA